MKMTQLRYITLIILHKWATKIENNERDIFRLVQQNEWLHNCYSSADTFTDILQII